MTDRQVMIEISISQQKLYLKSADTVLREYPVSTARNGAGEEQDSECTPRGMHEIAEKIGAGSPPGTVFVGRESTGETYHPELRTQYPDRDWILTRILWLRGLETGKNAGDPRDSYNRYIYIHGSPDDVTMGSPGSRGCIRMRNADVIELFERVDTGTRVNIYA